MVPERLSERAGGDVGRSGLRRRPCWVQSGHTRGSALPLTRETASQVVGKDTSRGKPDHSPDSAGSHVRVVSEAGGPEGWAPGAWGRRRPPVAALGVPPAHSPALPLVSLETDSASSSARCDRLVAVAVHGASCSPTRHCRRRCVLGTVAEQHPGPAHSLPGPPPVVMTTGVPTRARCPRGTELPWRGQRQGTRIPARLARARARAAWLSPGLRASCRGRARSSYPEVSKRKQPRQHFKILKRERVTPRGRPLRHALPACSGAPEGLAPASPAAWRVSPARTVLVTEPAQLHAVLGFLLTSSVSRKPAFVEKVQ